MEDQICSPEKYSIKNSYNKNIFYLNEKKTHDKNVSYWIQNYFDWIKTFWYHEKKKVIQWKYILLNTKLFWLNENIFSYHMNFYFCSISATINCTSKNVLIVILSYWESSTTNSNRHSFKVGLLPLKYTALLHIIFLKQIKPLNFCFYYLIMMYI